MTKKVLYGASITKYLGFNVLHPSTRDYGKLIFLMFCNYESLHEIKN